MDFEEPTFTTSLSLAFLPVSPFTIQARHGDLGWGVHRVGVFCPSFHTVSVGTQPVVSTRRPTLLNLQSTTDKCSSNPFSRNFSWQQMETITDSHNWPKRRNQETVHCLVPTDISTTQLLNLRVRGHFRRGSRKILRARETKFAGRLSLRNVREWAGEMA